MEGNIGSLTLRKDEMAAVREAQRLYRADWLDTDEVADKMGIPRERASRYIRYNTHFLSMYDLVPEDYDGDPFERLMAGKRTASAEQIVYRKVCVELLRELFDALPRKDRDILGKCYGVFGFPQTPLKDIGMYHMMKASAVEKARDRALKKLKKAYPGSRLQLWRAAHRLLRRPIQPPEENADLRVGFPQHVRVLAEVCSILCEAVAEEK